MASLKAFEEIFEELAVKTEPIVGEKEDLRLTADWLPEN